MNPVQQQMYINGEFVENRADRWIEVINPATEALLSRIPEGSAEDAQRAIDAAAAASGIATLAEADGILAAWFERHQCEAALVRPDHLVYGVARGAGEVEALMQRACRTLGATLNRPATALQEPT